MLGLTDVHGGLTFERAGRRDVNDQSARAFAPDRHLGGEYGRDPVATPRTKPISPVTASVDRLANTPRVELTILRPIPDIEGAAKTTVGANHVWRGEALADADKQDRPSCSAFDGVKLEEPYGELRIETGVEIASKAVAVRIEVEAGEPVQRHRDPSRPVAILPLGDSVDQQTAATVRQRGDIDGELALLVGIRAYVRGLLVLVVELPILSDLVGDQ